MTKNLVLVGGGHAHLTVLLRLQEFAASGHRVTVVSSSRHHYYSGMGPGLLAGLYEPGQVRFNIRKMAESGDAQFVEDDAVRVDPVLRTIVLRSGRAVGYDVASFKTGSSVPLEGWGAGSERVMPVKPIANLYATRKKIIEEIGRRYLRIVVIGGGPAGVEMAGGLWRLTRRRAHRAEITLVGGEKVLPRCPELVRSLALYSLGRRGVGVIEGRRAASVQEGRVTLADGLTLECDFVLMAVGVKPAPLFADSGLPVGEDGGLLVNSYLQSPQYPELFGGGDCISLEGNTLPKVGVYAVRQNPVLFHNLMSALEGEALHPFDDVGDYMLIMNMGDGTGIVWKKGRVWAGRLAFFLKDLIDRRFVAKFQVSDERGEPIEAR